MSEDDDLLAELRRVAAAVDPVPEVVWASAQAAISTRDLDRHLADLIADSARPSSEGAADDAGADAFENVRTWNGDGPASSRLLSFANGDVHVDLEVSEHGQALLVIGQFTGAAREECGLEFADGERLALDVDDLGRFLVDGVRRGLVRARCRSATGEPVVTAWVAL